MCQCNVCKRCRRRKKKKERKMWVTRRRRRRGEKREMHECNWSGEEPIG
jgi:hypothetical protein